MARHFEARIPVLTFKEDGKTIAYSPALDLSTYGNTEDQAKKRFAQAATIFLDEVRRMGTLEQVLEECGWRRVTKLRTWVPPVLKTSEQSIQIPVGAN